MDDKAIPTLGRWQVLTLALFSYGVLLAHSCTLSQVCLYLTNQASSATLERRLQRWLANDRIDLHKVFDYWVRWVLRLWGSATLIVLVDETNGGHDRGAGVSGQCHPADLAGV